MDDTSGVGVIDKSVAILDCASRGPVWLADLVDATGIPRPTAHRLAVAHALDQPQLLEVRDMP